MTNKALVVDLYTDGGVIDKNPSPTGGTFAWLLIEGDALLMQGSGIIRPNQITPKATVVTNNQMELLAVLRGLGAVKGKGWALRYIYSDSQVTLGRVFNGHALNNIPAWMVDLKRELLSVLKGVKGYWIRGHNGHQWNEVVDEACRKAGEKFVLKKGKK